MIYIGETMRTLRDRKNGHYSDINCRRTDKNEVAEHFCSGTCSYDEHFSIRAVLEVIDEHERLIKEARLIRKLGSLRPLGMNREPSSTHKR